MVGNNPGENFLGGNFPGEFSRGEFDGWEFLSGGKSLGEIFIEPSSS